MIALCTQWPAQDLALLRAELERAGVDVRVVQGECDALAQEADNVVRLDAQVQALRCEAHACRVLWQLPSETAALRREATSHLLESLRTRAGDWSARPMPAAPPLELPGPAAPPPTSPPRPPTPWSWYAGLRCSVAAAPLGVLPGVDLRAYYTVAPRLQLGLGAGALQSLNDRDAGGTQVSVFNLPVLAGVQWAARPWLRTGAWAGASLLHAAGAESPGTRARSGWAAAPRAEISVDAVVWRGSALYAAVGLRGGAWLQGVALVTEGVGAQPVRGADVAVTAGLTSAGW